MMIWEAASVAAPDWAGIPEVKNAHEDPHENLAFIL